MAGKRATKVTWQDPPPGPSRGAGKNHVTISQELKANPGAWANIGSYSTVSAAYGAASRIRTGACVAYRPAGSFEAVSRTMNNTYCVFARYVGEPGA